jgi:hypothetical protein
MTKPFKDKHERFLEPLQSLNDGFYNTNVESISGKVDFSYKNPQNINERFH